MMRKASTKENNLHVDTMHIKRVKQIGNLHIKADLQDKIKKKKKNWQKLIISL